MKPNLLVGDFIFVSKWSYGFSKHSFPFSIPLIPKKIFSKLPHRGDVVVFKTPEDNRTDYIKRVIGLSGDRIQIIDGQIIINDNLIFKKRVNDFLMRMPAFENVGIQTISDSYIWHDELFRQIGMKPDEINKIVTINQMELMLMGGDFDGDLVQRMLTLSSLGDPGTKQEIINDYSNNVTETIKNTLNNHAASNNIDVIVSEVKFNKIITSFGQYSLIIDYKKRFY